MNSFKTSINRFLVKAQFKLFRIKSVSRLVGWHGLYNFVVDTPNRFSYIKKMYLLTHRNRKLRTRLIAELMMNPECANLIRNRTVLTEKLEDLADCPEGSFGKFFYKHMMDNHIDFIIPLDTAATNDFQYIMYRIIATHDIYHAILGAHTDFRGEAMVASFTCSQIPSYSLAAIHAAAGTLRCAIKEHGFIDHANFDYVTGWLLGKSAKQLFAVNWSALWNKPLEAARAELGINLPKIQEIIRSLYQHDVPFMQTIPKIPENIKTHLHNHICRRERHPHALHTEFLPYSRKFGEMKKNIEDFKIKNSEHENIFSIESFEYLLKDPKAVVILGRALFTNGDYLKSLRRPSLAACFIQNGMHVLTPSVTPVDEGVEDIIDKTRECIAFARKKWPELPVFLVGHSLSGMCFLVQQGLCYPNEQVEGVVTLGGATWNHHFLKDEKASYRYKVMLVSNLLNTLCRVYGYLPVKLLRYGNHNESRSLVQQVIIDNAKRGSWRSLDQQINFYDCLKSVNCPVLSVASMADQYAPINLVRHFHQNLKHEPEMIIDDRLAHMELGSSLEAWDLWENIAEWIIKQGKDRTV